MYEILYLFCHNGVLTIGYWQKQQNKIILSTAATKHCKKVNVVWLLSEAFHTSHDLIN